VLLDPPKGEKQIHTGFERRYFEGFPGVVLTVLEE
jgi:hypothetical protein